METSNLLRCNAEKAPLGLSLEVAGVVDTLIISDLLPFWYTLAKLAASKTYYWYAECLRVEGFIYL